MTFGVKLMSRNLIKFASLGAGAAALALYLWTYHVEVDDLRKCSGSDTSTRNQRLTRSINGRRVSPKCTPSPSQPSSSLSSSKLLQRLCRNVRRPVPLELRRAAVNNQTSCNSSIHGNLWLRIVEAQESFDSKDQSNIWKAITSLGPCRGDESSLRGDVYFSHCNAAPPPVCEQNVSEKCRQPVPIHNKAPTNEVGRVSAADSIDGRAVDQIDRDVPRTFPSHSFFSKSQGFGQLSLRRVLVAWVSWEREFLSMLSKDGASQKVLLPGSNQDDFVTNKQTNDSRILPTAYVQGMNMIVAHLLKHLDEVHAFQLFCHVMVNPMYNFRHVVCPGMPGLFEHQHILDSLIHQHIPAVAHVLGKANITVVLFSTEWILTLFAYVLEGRFLNMFLDRFFAFGWPAFYQVALSLLESRLQDMEYAISLMSTSSHETAAKNEYATPHEGVLSIVKGIGRRQQYHFSDNTGCKGKSQEIESIFERALDFSISYDNLDRLLDEYNSKHANA